MDLSEKIPELVIGIVVVDFILLKLIYYPWIAKKEKYRKRAMWGNMLVVLGVILTSFGTFLLASYLFFGSKTIDPAMLLALSPFVLVGIPSLIIGILMVNHPSSLG
jgi:hypothetical protein